MSIMPHRIQLGVGMLRAIVVAGIIVSIILLGLFGFRWLQTAQNEAPGAGKAVCDLLAGPCEWQTETGLWKVDLDDMVEGEQGKEYRLTVHAPKAPERFLAVLRGESMYMGEYPVPLRREDDGQYSAQFAAPLCTTGSEMVWRVDLQQGQQPLPETAPLKLIFRAGDH